MTAAGLIAGTIRRTTPLTWRIAIAALIGAAVLLAAHGPQRPGLKLRLHPGTAAPHDEAPPAAPSVGPPPPLDMSDAEALPVDAARAANAALPIVDAGVSPAAPFRFIGDDTARLRARDCLALAAYHEAGDDPPGERAVVQVVLNRVRHPAFPASICAVVFQGSERRTGCQFTFTCDGALARPPSPPALARVRAIAQAALNGAVDGRIGLATHYHADYVVPNWRDGLVKIAQQGAHLFYRWPGYWGSAAATRRGSGSSGIEPPIPALAVLSDAPEPQTVPPMPIAPPALPAPAAPRTAADPLARAHEIPLPPDAASGSFALTALDLCGRTHDCRVAGHVDRDLAFLYVRRGGTEGVYWDCHRYRRADPAQCLPGGTALDRLLAAG